MRDWRQTDRQTDIGYSPLTTSRLNNEQAKMLADTVSVTAAESTAAPENKSLSVAAQGQYPSVAAPISYVDVAAGLRLWDLNPLSASSNGNKCYITLYY